MEVHEVHSSYSTYLSPNNIQCSTKIIYRGEMEIRTSNINFFSSILVTSWFCRKTNIRLVFNASSLSTYYSFHQTKSIST